MWWKALVKTTASLQSRLSGRSRDKPPLLTYASYNPYHIFTCCYLICVPSLLPCFSGFCVWSKAQCLFPCRAAADAAFLWSPGYDAVVSPSLLRRKPTNLPSLPHTHPLRAEQWGWGGGAVRGALLGFCFWGMNRLLVEQLGWNNYIACAKLNSTRCGWGQTMSDTEPVTVGEAEPCTAVITLFTAKHLMHRSVMSSQPMACDLKLTSSLAGLNSRR